MELVLFRIGGGRVWKNGPAAPEAQGFPWGRSWERQRGWGRGVVALEGDEAVGMRSCALAEEMPVVFRGADHLCSPRI